MKRIINVNEGVSFIGKEIQINGDGRVQEIAFIQEIKNDRVHPINEELGITFSSYVYLNLNWESKLLYHAGEKLMIFNDRNNNYNQRLTNHLLIFLSIIYAFVISEWLKGWYNQYYNNNSIYSIHLAWSLIVLFLVVESWWGLWNTKILFIKNVFSFGVVLIHPFMLSVLNLLLFPNKPTDLEIYFINQNPKFFGFATFIFFFIALEKTVLYQKKILRIPNLWRLAGGVICFLLVYSNNLFDPPSTIDFYLFHFFFITVSFILLLLFTLRYKNHFNRIRYTKRQDFIDYLLYIASRSYRKNAPYSFIVIKKEKNIAQITLRLIATMIRPSDILFETEKFIIIFPSIDKEADVQPIVNKIKQHYSKLKINISLNHKIQHFRALEETKDRNKISADIEIQLNQLLNDCLSDFDS
ncbi:hypothetical protein [uncultured Desulfobacter sp.]|uniref:hypothetical protein n=1 Tax=uncultured Desulfobacter sp. TaxID=240139 RepID=UPI0029F5AFD1|nr:hypothetical protein [uncultured Desulfobacter sp.]